MLIIAVLGLIAVGFATYQAYQAWGGVKAFGVFVGLLLVDLIPYAGALIVIFAAKYCYDEASKGIMDEAEAQTRPSPRSGVGSTRSSRSTSSGSSGDPLERIEKLEELREKGAISDEEFEQKKSKLLDEV
jgi:uncharacterized membrane protein